MKLVDTLSGKGTVIAATGTTPVSYVINIYQSQIPAGNGETIPGHKDARGRINPALSLRQERLKLQLSDGSTLAFLIIDSKGNIQGTGGIQPPIAT